MGLPQLVDRGDVVGRLEAESLPVGLHRPGEDQIGRPAPELLHADQARPRLRHPAALEKGGQDRVRLVEGPGLRVQAQGGPGGAVLPAQLLHGLGDDLRVQVGVQAVDDLQGAPGHAVGGKGRVLLPLQGVPEGGVDEQAPPGPEQQAQRRQHPQRHLHPEFHGPTSSR